MTPRDRAERLRERARTDPSAVNPDAVLELLRHPSRAVQREAADALLPIVTEHPAAATGGIGRIDHLLRTITRSEEGPAAHAEFGETLLLCLARIAGADVEKSLDAADTVLTLLGPDGPLAAPASACLIQLIAVRPGAFVHDVDQISALLTAEDSTVRRHGAHALVELGTEEPETVRRAVPELRDSLRNDDAEAAQKAGVVVGQGRQHRRPRRQGGDPGAIRRARRRPRGLRANAVGEIADLAADLPAAIDGRQAALTDRTDDEATSVRRNAAAALGRLADGVELDEPAHGGLVELLDDPDATVRATACRALGQLRSPAVAELLRTTANGDEELVVRKAAERALED